VFSERFAETLSAVYCIVKQWKSGAQEKAKASSNASPNIHNVFRPRLSFPFHSQVKIDFLL